MLNLLDKMLKLQRSRSQILLICGLISSVVSINQYESSDDYGGGNSECALLLEGPGRSSAFDYSLNTLRNTPNNYGGGAHTCITYDAVNNAYGQARKYIRVAERRERYQHEELATVGELLLEVSRILGRTYGLSVDEIEHGLPLIDTSKTAIREICPAFLSNVHCQPGKYRRYDGLCNNLKHPTWGAVQSTFTRLLKPVYSDAVSDPRVGSHGSALPPPRIVSRTIHPDEGYHDHAATILLISWGQFMDHDLTLTATPLDPVTRNEPEECCRRAPNSRNPYCLQIDIPHDDPFYGVYGVRCIDFVRGFPGVRAGCRLGSRNQFNILTGILDGNTVYGVEENFARSLRTGYGGLLRMNPVFAQYGLHDLLPLKLDIPDEGCSRPNKSMYCFDAGEIRVNEQLVLTCMHTLMAREHNRVASKMGEINPHWDDETIYQESRRIVIGEIQHITYNEFLPLVLGKEVMAKFGLLLQKDGYWDGYDENVNPGVIASFAAAAFRFGHSLLPTNVERWSKAHKFIASRRLRDLIRQPFDLYRAGVIDEYFMGMSNQVAQAMDDSVTQEVTNHLFRKPNQPFGVDLAAFNMQRGREVGLPSYMEYRKYCGLPGATGWDDLFGSMNNITVKRYAQIYVHPQDIDLWSGGVSERPLPGAMVGPTFACIIASQFSNARRGDRFWYELGGHPHSFTTEQLAEIRKSRLARIVCDNTDLIDTIQLYPMVLPDHEINPRVPCRSGVLLHVDLTKWADYGGQYSNHAPVHVPAPLLSPRVPESVVANLLPNQQQLSSNRIVRTFHGKANMAPHFGVPADEVNLSGYENDPAVGKYVNQDGLQQLRHYLKVGPYKSYLSGSNKAFMGYVRQVLNRRPVTLIHSTKGHDATNLANVHYSPGPEHDNIPNPGVDYSPRGNPVHQGHSLEKARLEDTFEAQGYNGPLLNPQQAAGGGYQYNTGIPQNGIDISTPVDSEFFNHAAPIKIYYGFRPVATPYGNISSNQNDLGAGFNYDFKRKPSRNEFGSGHSHNTINYKRKRQTSQQQTETENRSVPKLKHMTTSQTIQKISSKGFKDFELIRAKSRTTRSQSWTMTLTKDDTTSRPSGSFQQDNINRRTDLHHSTSTQLHTDQDTSLSHNSKPRLKRETAAKTPELNEKEKHRVQDFNKYSPTMNTNTKSTESKISADAESRNNSESFLDAAEDFVDGAVSTAIHFVETFADYGSIVLTNIQSTVNYFANATVAAVNRQFLNDDKKGNGTSSKVNVSDESELKSANSSNNSNFNLSSIINTKNTSDSNMSIDFNKRVGNDEEMDSKIENDRNTNHQFIRMSDFNLKKLSSKQGREGLANKTSFMVKNVLKNFSFELNRWLQL